MDLSHTCLLCLLVFNIKTSTSQFLPVTKKVNKATICDAASKTALVEHFFNVIFTEFHNNPPVCVCVQMCADQPTYCYPNGCLKKVDTKKKDPEENKPAAPVMRADDVINTMFLVENDFSRLMNENVDVKNVPVERFSIKDVRPDPFKDRYKSLFKYKKMPKVELRYNLREQVKNMKSDILKVETKDVSKTRWPKNNHLVIHDRQIFSLGDKLSEKNSADTITHKFFIQGPTEGFDRDLYSPKFFKRDLRRNNKDDPAQPEYLTDTPDPLEAKTFSLETLIENLIGNNFERKPDGEIALKGQLNESRAISEVTNTTENISNNTDTKNNKEITCIVSLNMTNENLDENKYEENPVIKKHLDKWKNYTFNEMIAALSKRIDKQNNTSLELMKDASRDKIEVTITGPINLKEKDNLSVMDEPIVKEHKNKTKTVSDSDCRKENATEEVSGRIN